MKFRKCFLFFLCFLLWTSQSKAEPTGDQNQKDFHNVSTLYLIQWGYYIVDQNETIRKNGSFENWRKFMFRPHFDDDNIEYNLIAHPAAGAYYYLYYRQRGYSEVRSFAFATLSSALFEFTIETVTERPSFQDLYQTPALGTVLGIGLEQSSKYLHSIDRWWSHFLGYILNPMPLLFPENDKISALPMIKKNGGGVSLTLKF